MDLKTSALLLKYSPSDVQRVRYVVEYANHNTNNPSEYIDVHTHSNAQKEIAKIFVETANAATLNMKSSDASPKIDTVKEKETTVDPQCENQKTINAKPSGASAKTEEVTVEGAKKIEEGKKGLWANIHAKRKRGEAPAKPGDKDYPETLNVEEVENLDELSKKTLGGYVAKASKEVAGHMKYTGDNPDAKKIKQAQIHKRIGGMTQAGKKMSEAYASVYEKYDNRYSDNTGEESAKKKAALEKKRGMKLDNHPQFKREEVEQIDELKDTTLKSYIDKAQVAAKSLASKREVAKKKQGIDRAVDTITGTKKKRPKSRYDIKNYEGQKKQYLVGKETRKNHKEYGKIPRNDAYIESVEHIEEQKPPRTAKGAMAYDGPNKAASEARDRVIAKTKALRKKKGIKPTVNIDAPDRLVSLKIKEAVANYRTEFKNYDAPPDEKGNIPKGSTGSGKYSMSKKDYKKTHKDFKSDDPKNPRISHYDKGTKSSPVKFVEHHQKDENGKVIEHEDTTPSSVEEGLKQARKNVGASKCWDGKKIGSPPTKTKNGKEVPNCVPEEIIKSTTFVISETPKGDAGKDRATKVKDRSARSYGGSDTYGAKYNAPIRRTLHDMKRGVKKDKGHVNRPNKPTSKFDDDRQGGAHWHNQGQGLAGTKKHGKSDYAEPSRKKVKKENYSWRERMEEGMATPESGTGKYYVQGKPTAMQLKKRAEMEKVKKYGSVEAHDKKMNK